MAITPEGEVLSIARYVGKKAKEVRAKLGEPDETLPDVESAKRDMAMDMRRAFVRHAKEAKSERDGTREHLKARTAALIQQQIASRQALEDRQRQRWLAEMKARSERLNSGLKGLWRWVTGQRAQIQRQNKQEAFEAQRRDRAEQDRIIAEQLAERRAMKDRQVQMEAAHRKTLTELREDQKRMREKLRALQDAQSLQQGQTRQKRERRSRRTTRAVNTGRSRDGPEFEP